MSTRNEKAPDLLEQGEGNSSREEPAMSATVRPRGKYANYTVEVDDVESKTEVWYEDRGPQVLKVTARIFRIPSKTKFVIRHFEGATTDDRAEVEALIPRLRRIFEVWESGGKSTRRRHPEKGYYYEIVCTGSWVNDPLIQLELEMMLDNDMSVGDALRLHGVEAFKGSAS